MRREKAEVIVNINDEIFKFTSFASDGIKQELSKGANTIVYDSNGKPDGVQSTRVHKLTVTLMNNIENEKSCDAMNKAYEEAGCPEFTVSITTQEKGITYKRDYEECVFEQQPEPDTITGTEKGTIPWIVQGKKINI